MKNKKIIISIILLCFYTGAIFFSGAILHRSGFLRKAHNAILLREKRLNFISGLLANPETIFIDIKYKNFQKLVQKREKALSKGVLITSPDDYIPAIIRHQDKSIKVDIRLKGDLPDHFATEKWSFRIKIKGDNALFGMRYFSIQHPKTRDYIQEWLFHQSLKREGVIALRYKFINAVLNGKPLGIYALEEFFDTRLIEYNERRDGPIIRFNEPMRFERGLGNGVPYLSSDIDAFHTNKIVSDPLMYSQFIKATNLLESFRRGLLKTCDVFDTQKLARFFAIGELTGSTHGMDWNNAKFYYNPITSRLEPIGFDGHTEFHEVFPITTLWGIKYGINIANSNVTIMDDFNAMIFNDELFFKQYLETLARISDPSYLDKLFEDLNGEMTKNLNILHKEFPSYDFSKDLFYKNQEYIRAFLNPLKGMHAYYHSATLETIKLELGNIQSIPIEVLNVSYKGSVFYPAQKTFLPAKTPLKPVNYQSVGFLLPKGFLWSDTMTPDLKINYKLFGISQERYELVFPWPYLDDNFVKADFVRQNPNIYEFNFLAIDEITKKIFIKPGAWGLDKNLIIPEGYKIICADGTQINLSNSAKVFSYSPLEFIGAEENPILIHSEDGSGQGIVVVDASQKSLLKNVIFDNLSNPSQSRWELTGAVTFYESPVEISDCQFSNNNSEDSLSIIRSEFTINNTRFNQTFSDALDVDFCKGKITNAFFMNSGNDAIDACGSAIELNNIVINNTGDKGISAGENSQVEIGRIEIKNAALAVASKDMSNVKIYNIKIMDSKIGLAVYQKKPEFGPAKLDVIQLETQNVSKLYLLENNSSLFVRSVDFFRPQAPFEPNQENVFEYLYGRKK